MRVVDIEVPSSSRDHVTDLLDDHDVDYVTVPSADGDGVIISFPIPPQGVEEILGLIDEDHGVDYTVVATAETASTEHMAELEDRYVADDGERDNVALAELRSRALGMNPSSLTYYSMTLLSAVVATAGLLLDAPTIVVGSMVIAPQVGTAMTTGVGTVVDDRKMIRDGLRSQILGLGVAVAGAAIFGFLVKSAAFVPPTLSLTTTEQISQRTSPGLLSLAVGVCAGAAGAFGLATALPVSLVGVMIAAALIPAAGAAGIGIAWGLPAVTQGSLVLLLVNVASINVCTVVVLWGLGYRPSEWDADDTWSLRRLRTHVPAVVTVLLLVATFAGASVVVVDQMYATNTVNDEVSDTLADEPYRRVQLRSVTIEFETPLDDSTTREVSVTVARPSDERYPGLASTLDRRLTRVLGRPVTMDVTLVPRQQTT
jgi:uncharacterized hydrophobic protein (TIGR00271 family)